MNMTRFFHTNYMLSKAILPILLPVAFFLASGCPAFSQQPDAALQNQPQAQWLKRQVGTWQVTMTAQLLPGARPMVTKGIVAERSLINDLCLYEVMRPVAGSGIADFQRISYLAYNLNERRWDYVSMDSRITAGLMYFVNFESNADSITSYIASFPYPGFGPEDKVRGMSVAARNVIVSPTSDHQVVRQYWRFAAGSEWKGMEYDYSRKSGSKAK